MTDGSQCSCFCYSDSILDHYMPHTLHPHTVAVFTILVFLVFFSIFFKDTDAVFLSTLSGGASFEERLICCRKNMA